MGHQPTRRIVRSVAPAAAAALALLAAGVLSAAPAHAEGRHKYMYLEIPEAVTVLPRTAATGDAFKPLVVSVTDDEGLPLSNLVATVDASALAGKAELQLPAGCSFTDAAHLRASCTAAKAASKTDFRLGIRAAQGATAGAHGAIHYTATADDATLETDPLDPSATQVTVASGPDLAVRQLPTETKIVPGGSVTVPAQVANIGDQDAKGLVMIAELENGFRLSGNYRNCRYGVGGAESVGGTAVLCRFDSTTLPVGATFQLSAPLTVSAAKDAATGFLAYAFDVAGGQIDGSRVTGGTPGTGPELTLSPVPGTRAAVKDIDFSDNTATTTLDTGLRTDLAVSPVSVSGTVGKPLALGLTVRNVGTAAAQPFGTGGFQPPSGEVPASVSALALVGLPAGVEVQQAPRYCTPEPDFTVPAGAGAMAQRFTGRLREQLRSARTRAQGAPSYLCWVGGKLASGASRQLEFTVKPKRTLHRASGLFAVMALSVDSNEANDMAWIRITAEAAAGGSTVPVGSTGGSTPAPQTTGGTSAGSPSPTAPATGGSAGGSVSGGSLAATGSSGTGLLAGAGAVAVVAGAAVVLAVRRRRA
ncbi:LPXTG cell wall anchor domain-containing protein [Peterkaempfera griseoplana]|uniref:LPXTG cell wall anchor domain-containing protein n=1 Tax=Peterkaempfera griseoplana TaxID=66896 RepID=UPI0006E2411D|nr:LPXTG cell wall anchor domain-containing protein [Peterkaempfera griseoplana]